MKPQLILLRGLPGSGKSTLARTFLTLGIAHVHCEADQHMHNDEGQYEFIPTNLTEAHTRCFVDTRYALRNGLSVVVANTFTQRWEMDRYEQLAQMLNVPCVTFTCRGPFPNIHNVPDTTILEMRQHWED